MTNSQPRYRSCPFRAYSSFAPYYISSLKNQRLISLAETNKARQKDRRMNTNDEVSILKIRCPDAGYENVHRVIHRKRESTYIMLRIHRPHKSLYKYLSVSYLYSMHRPQKSASILMGPPR